MYSREFIKQISDEIYNNLSKNGIKVKNIILFGSYANGMAHDNSDIDIAIVSDEFSGIRFFDFEMIKKYIINFPDVEVHPFRTCDFSIDNPFVKKIKENSIILH